MSSADSVTQLKALPQELCVHHILEAWAERTPEGIAMAAPGRSPLRYGRLLTHIKNVVKTLNAMGVGRNDRVAVVLPHGPEMTVALLAVTFCATAAPMNPTYSGGEFDFCLADLNVKALVVQSRSDSPARASAQKRGIPIFELSPMLEAESGIFALTGDERPRPACSGAAQPGDVALVIHTSGTTSRPKIVPLTQANICTSANAIKVALGLTESDRCLNPMPLFHIHGIMVTLSSLLAGGSVCSVRFASQSFFQCLDEFDPTWYTAAPTVHQVILSLAEANQEIIAGSRLRFIRSSSASLALQVMAELEGVLHAPVIESYGMTEAAHQITSNSLPSGTLKAGSVGVAAGPKVAIMDEGGNLLSPGETGEIVIQGGGVFRGYENNPTANADAFTNGWFRTGDQGFLDSEGCLFITGRLTDIVNRGGEKISPREVDEVLMSHPAVAQAVTFAVPHATLGEDIAAAVTLRESTSITDKDIRKFVAGRLANFKVPRQILIVDEIPMGPTGKLRRKDLGERLGLTSSHLQRAYVAPRDTLELRMAKLWEKVLGIHPIGVEDNFFDLGGNSLLAVILVARIEKICNKSIPAGALFLKPTVREMASALREEEWVAPCSLLVPLQPSDSGPPFLCVHGVTGWARHFHPDEPFYSLRPHGLDGRRAPSTVEERAADYIQEIRALQPEGPYFLGGYSSGGVTAFEVAQQLQKQGAEIGLLVLIEPACPGVGASSLLSRITRFRENVDRRWRRLALLRSHQKLTYLLVGVTEKIKDKFKHVACRIYIGIGRRLPPFLRMFYCLEAARQATRKYIPKAYPGRIILFLAEKGIYDARSCWSRLAAGGSEIHVLPGSHLDIIEEPHAKVWAEQLRVCLCTAQATESSKPARAVVKPARALSAGNGRKDNRP